MERRAFLALLTAACLPVLGLQACGGNGAPLTLGIHYWPGYEPLLLAHHFNWLPAQVRFEQNRNASQSIDSLKAGKIDGACLTLDEALTLRAEGVPLTIVLALDISAGADKVLVRQDIRALSDLKGKRIAYEHGALGSLMYYELLRAAGLEKNDLATVKLSPDMQFLAWEQGEVDAVITYPPYSTRIENAGGKVIFDSRQTQTKIMDVLAIRNDRLSAKSSLVKMLVASHLRAIDYMRLNSEDAMRRIAASRNISYEDTVQDFGGISLPGLDANRKMLASGSGINKDAAKLAAIMVDAGILSRPDNLVDLADDGYLPESL